MALPDAIADLDELGLKYESIAEENSTVAENIIHRTDPVAGTIVVDNQTIKLFYNPPKELQEVPNVEGLPSDEAQQVLSAAGFRIGTISAEESDAIAENAVIRTDPGAGEQVPQDTVINIVVSGGREERAVPSIVIGQPEATARQLLENDPYFFVVSTTMEESSTIAPGLVIRTNPPAQSLLAEGGQITLVVSSGPPAITVPNVVGLSEPAARGQLAQFDVSVTVQDLPAGDANDGLVTGQSIAAGQQAPAGSPIQLTVGRAAATDHHGGTHHHGARRPWPRHPHPRRPTTGERAAPLRADPDLWMPAR